MRSLTALFGPKITLAHLSDFSGNLALCVSSGLDIPRSLTTCQRTSPSAVLREILPLAAKQAAAGASLFQALEPHHRCFPVFYLPVLRCGEESGRLDQTLRYLEGHCRLLVEPARTMRNTWLVPLGLMLGCSVICSLAYCIWAPRAMAIGYIFDWLRFYASMAIVVGVAFCVPPVRALADALRLLVPVIGLAERELTMNRFFHAMNLLYSADGRRVEEMIRLSAESTENVALRNDFLRAAEVIESGGTIGEAFSAVAHLPFDYKTYIVAGDESGKLEDAFNLICQQSGESVVALLEGFQQLFFRVVAMAAVLFLVATFLFLGSLRHKR